MAEERKDLEQPEADEPETKEPQSEGQMQDVTPPESQSLSEEATARRELDAEAEESGSSPGDEREGPEQAGEEDAIGRPLTEDVAEAGELLTDEVPSEIADEAVKTVEYEASKARENVGPRAGLTDDETEGEPEDRPVEEQTGDERGESAGTESESDDQAAARRTDEAMSAAERVDEEAEEEQPLPDESDPEPLEEEEEEEEGEPENGRVEESRPSPGTAAAAPAAAGGARATAQPTPRQREHRPSRRTLAREERRRRSQARRRRRRTIYGILGGSVAAMLILGLVLGDVGLTPQAPPANGGQQPAQPVGTQMDIQEGEIIQPGTEHPGYTTVPPTSGPRYEEPAPWGIHDERQEDEAIVRNLQVGGVVFNHNLTDESALEELRDYVGNLPGYPACYIMHPYPEIPEGTVVLTAWGWMQEFNSFSRSEKDDFTNYHRNQGPLFLSQTCGYEPPALEEEEAPDNGESEDEPTDENPADGGE